MTPQNETLLSDGHRKIKHCLVMTQQNETLLSDDTAK